MSQPPQTLRLSQTTDPLTGAITLGDGDSREASFSPDGRLVIYTSLATNLGLAGADPDQKDDLYLHVLATGQNLLLTPDALLPTSGAAGTSSSSSQAVFAPVTSGPPGTYRVAFVTDSDGVGSAPGTATRDVAVATVTLDAVTQQLAVTGMQVFALDAEVVDLSNHPRQPRHTMAWSPDGTKLAFVAQGNIDAAEFDAVVQESPDLFVLTLATGHVERITQVFQSYAGIGGIAWSPDGGTIAFDSESTLMDVDMDGESDLPTDPEDRSEDIDVFVVDLASRSLERVTPNPDIDGNPSRWQGAFVTGYSPVATAGRTHEILISSDVSFSQGATGRVDVLPIPQVMTLSSNVFGGDWRTHVLSTASSGEPALSGVSPGSFGATAARPNGATWVGYSSTAQDVDGTAPWVGPSDPEPQGLVTNGIGPAILVSRGSSAGEGANAGVSAVSVAPVSYAATDVFGLASGNPGSAWLLASFNSAATNLLDAPLQGVPSMQQVYLSVVRETAPVIDLQLSGRWANGDALNGSSFGAIRGQTFDFSLQIDNTSLVASHPVVGLTLPAGVELVGVQPSSLNVAQVGQTLRWNAAPLAGGGTSMAELSLRSSNSGPIVLTPEIVAGEADPDSTPGNGYVPTEDDALQFTVQVVEPPISTIRIGTVNNGVEGTPGAAAGSPIVFELLREGDVTSAATVTYSVAGSSVEPAATGADLLAGLGHFSATFAAGQRSVLIPIDLREDAAAEPDEGIQLVLTGTSFGAPDPAASQAVASIVNDDWHVYRVSAAEGDVEGTGPFGGRVSFTFERSWSPADGPMPAAELAYRLQGSLSGATLAVATGDDLVGGEQSFGDHVVRFEAGQATARIDLNLVADSLDEHDETVELALTTLDGLDPFARLGGDATLQPSDSLMTNGLLGNGRGARATIVDDDDPTWVVSVVGDPAIQVDEGGTVRFTFERHAVDPDGQPVLPLAGLSVAYTLVGGTASAGDLGLGNEGDSLRINGVMDFGIGTEAFLLFPVTDDPLSEPPEDLVLTLNAAVETNGAIDPAANRQSVVILDNDGPAPAVSIASGVFTTVEGTAPGAGGRLTVNLSRSGNLQAESIVGFSLDAAGLAPDAYADPADIVAGIPSLVFAPGESTATVSINVVPDAVGEPTELLPFRLVSIEGLNAGTVDTTTVLLRIEDDDGSIAPIIGGSDTTPEGSTYSLTVLPGPGAPAPERMTYQFNWGDGSPLEVRSGLDLQAGNGLVAHRYLDDQPGPFNNATARTISVTATVIGSAYSASTSRIVTVEDVAPTIALGGPILGGGLYELDRFAPYRIMVGPVSDPGDDPVNEIRVEWAGGIQGGGGTIVLQNFNVPREYSLPFLEIGVTSVDVHVRNDDGDFLVGHYPVTVGGWVGRASPSGTAGEWLRAWSHPSVVFSHKANINDSTEAWSPVSLSSVGSGTLAGGDIYGGGLGVSGTRADGFVVRQEINGTEGLRIQFAEQVNGVRLSLERLFPNEGAIGNKEAARIEAFNAADIKVGEWSLYGANLGGLSSIPVLRTESGFDSLVLTAGAYIGGQFVPGAQVNASLQGIAPTSSASSDFLLDGVYVLYELPALVGIAPDGMP